MVAKERAHWDGALTGELLPARDAETRRPSCCGFRLGSINPKPVPPL